MTSISTKIPDTLFRQAKSIAESEEITFDEVSRSEHEVFLLILPVWSLLGSSNSNIS